MLGLLWVLFFVRICHHYHHDRKERWNESKKMMGALGFPSTTANQVSKSAACLGSPSATPFPSVSYAPDRGDNTSDFL
jgi:hypothetical protein